MRVGRRRLLRVMAAAGLIAARANVLAQPSGKVYRIGWLDLGAAPSPPSTPSPSFDAFRRGLSDLGWIEGRNIAIEHRYADDDTARLATFAAELVGLKVDVIVTITTQAALAAKKATDLVPIVMAGSSRPVELGLIQSLARPGGNVTGVTNNPGTGYAGKLMQYLKEAAPRVSRMALLWSSTAPGEADALRAMQAAASVLGIAVVHAEARYPSDVQAALDAILRQRADGLYATPSSTNTQQRRMIVDFALANRIPSIYADARWVKAGGLMSYGVDWLELRRHSATYVDKILRGAKPGDLPVEDPRKIELVINLKTAMSIGLTIPQSLMLRVDEVIQ